MNKYLLKIFFILGFRVKIHRNLTAKEIIHKAESYGKMEQPKGVLFLIILSHGTLVENKMQFLAQMVNPLPLKAYFI